MTAFLPRPLTTRPNDTLFLHQHDKNIWIEFQDFEEVMSKAKMWLIDWQTTNKPVSLEEFLFDQESFLKRKYGEQAVELAKSYVLLSSIFHIAIKTAGQRPERLHKLFEAVNEFS